MDETTDDLGEFFDYIWGTEKHDSPVFVYLPVKHDGKWTKFMFAWPKQRAGVVRHVLQWRAQSADVYYCPALFSVANPQKENVLGSWFLWIDSDGNAPDWDADIPMSIPRPSLRIQSSLPGHEHAYWHLDEFLTDIDTLEERNRALALALSADMSGWDADQVLRPPYTHNFKRDAPVTVLEWEE